MIKLFQKDATTWDDGCFSKCYQFLIAGPITLFEVIVRNDNLVDVPLRYDGITVALFLLKPNSTLIGVDIQTCGWSFGVYFLSEYYSGPQI